MNPGQENLGWNPDPKSSSWEKAGTVLNFAEAAFIVVKNGALFPYKVVCRAAENTLLTLGSLKITTSLVSALVSLT